MNVDAHPIATKTKVLIFGAKVIGSTTPPPIQNQNADIEFIAYPHAHLGARRLENYDVVILDYAAFINSPNIVDSERQEAFIKQMSEALKRGTTVCFVFYAEFCPPDNPYGGSQFGGMERSAFAKAQHEQIGFYWLAGRYLRPNALSSPVVSARIIRQEFKPFLDQYGAAKVVFTRYDAGTWDDAIQEANDGVATAFRIDAHKGMIVYLPYQRVENVGDSKGALTLLIDGLLTYASRNREEIPAWASQPLFADEVALREKLSHLISEVDTLQSDLQKFDDAKALLFKRGSVLEKGVLSFFKSRLGIVGIQNERFEEDFWLQDEKGEKFIVGEVKSTEKGFKKSFVYDAYNHREANGLSEDFPALLIVNANLQAGNLTDKRRAIDAKDCRVAVDNHVLVMRVEDLLQLWDGLRTGKWTTESVRKLLSSYSGWIEITASHEVLLHDGDSPKSISI